MGSGLKRKDLQARSTATFEDSLFLLRNKRYSNAYYLSGYSVEIGLKACIAKQICAETIPDEDFMDRNRGIMTHDFSRLVGLAGLQRELKDAQNNDAIFGANWAIVNEWHPRFRYETKDPMSAQLIVAAIGDENSGVMQWIRKHW